MCVSSKVLISVLWQKADQTKNNETYNGTKIGNYFRNASSEAGFNELMRVFRDGVSKQERL